MSVRYPGATKVNARLAMAEIILFRIVLRLDVMVRGVPRVSFDGDGEILNAEPKDNIALKLGQGAKDMPRLTELAPIRRKVGKFYMQRVDAFAVWLNKRWIKPTIEPFIVIKNWDWVSSVFMQFDWKVSRIGRLWHSWHLERV